MRAERKCGEMLRQTADTGERASRIDGRPKQEASHAPTLSEIGITRDQSSRYQQLASMTDEHFEAAVATARRSVVMVDGLTFEPVSCRVQTGKVSPTHEAGL